MNTFKRQGDENPQMERQVPVCFRCGNSGHIAKFCNVKLEEGMGPNRASEDEKLKRNDPKVRLSTVSQMKRKSLWLKRLLMGKTNFV